MSNCVAWIDGLFVSASGASSSFAKDPLGEIRGFRIFTACRTCNGAIFHLEDHLDRLFDSAQKVAMIPPFSRDRVRQVVLETLAENQKRCPDVQEFVLMILFSGGMPGPDRLSPVDPSLLYVLVDGLPAAAGTAPKPLYLATYPYQRQWPDVKFTNYTGGVIAQLTVSREKGADYPLFVSPEAPHWIKESPTASFFAVRNQTLLTPPLDGSILAGITRKVILHLVREAGVYEVQETALQLSEASTFDEAFIASSVRNVAHVGQIDDMKIGTGEAGPITQWISNRLGQYQNAYS